MVEVYFNNKYVGEVDDPYDFVDRVKTERKRNPDFQEANVIFDHQEKCVLVETSRGRLRRPLIVVKQGVSLLTEKHLQQLQKGEITWQDLLQQGVIEYLDALEEEQAYVAFTLQELTAQHTHLEVSPVAMMGLATSLVPFANYTQAPRILIGSKNQKQAIGLYIANFPQRIDMDVNLLHYPQVPLVQSIMHPISNYDQHPSGQNVVVAVMSFEGYNMDDAIIVNKGSIERGFGRSSYYRPVISEELRYSGGLMDEVSIPDKEIKGYRSEQDYRYLEEDGIIFPEAKVDEGDVIIGKTSPPRFLSGIDEYNLSLSTRRESSSVLQHGESGVIDFVSITENQEGNKLIQVRVRDQRTPEIGDKFTSRHGQKGVIGLIVPDEDIPFTASGLKPDIIFSPHSIPTRMTISHIIEVVAGKTAALSGRYVDGTIFDSESVDDLRKELNSLGFRENGVETVYNPYTGKELKARIFIGNIYYLKLRHLVANKIHARARGPVQLLTRQPTEGRSKEGGLRLGEMEKDTFVAHGASLTLKERFDSDRTIVPVCEKCGTVAIYQEQTNKNYCPICQESSVNNIEISYAFKLLLDELKSFCLFPRLKLKSKYTD